MVTTAQVIEKINKDFDRKSNLQNEIEEEFYEEVYEIEDVVEEDKEQAKTQELVRAEVVRQPQKPGKMPQPAKSYGQKKLMKYNEVVIFVDKPLKQYI